MSKIFKIAGNFNQSRCSFDARVVVENDNGFRGYCKRIVLNSHYSTVFYFITGVVAESGGATGIAFYLLSNESKNKPLMFVVPDITEAGECGDYDDFGSDGSGDGSSRCEAEITTFKEMPYSAQDEEYIKTVCFDNEVDFKKHERVLGNIERCRYSLEMAQAKRRMRNGD